MLLPTNRPIIRREFSRVQPLCSEPDPDGRIPGPVAQHREGFLNRALNGLSAFQPLGCLDGMPDGKR
jgi:hypothetical protein